MSLVKEIGRGLGAAQFVASEIGNKLVEAGMKVSPFGCGITDKGIEVHDHAGRFWTRGKPNTRYVSDIFNDTPYNERDHGKIVKWTEEGERVPGLRNSTDGKPLIHDHRGRFASGAVEYEYKDIS